MIHLELTRFNKIIENINLPLDTTVEKADLFRGTYDNYGVFTEDEENGNELAIKLKLYNVNPVYINCTELLDDENNNINKFLKEIEKYYGKTQI